MHDAYYRRVQLWAAGFYRTAGLHWDATRMQGEPFKYFAYGAAAAEVEVDGFTGAYRLRRADIVHDVGDSLSPLVDLGQIEGGFVQGVGWLTLEELLWDETDGPHRGRLNTQAASTYKIPSFSEMPPEFNVHLFERATESGVVYGSKAVGEPPLMEAFSVREALRQAVAAFGPAGWSVDLGCPSTPEAVYWAVQAARDAAAQAEQPAPGLRGGLTMDWLRAAQQLRDEGQPGVLVTVAEVRGHAPREAGAKMVVSRDRTWGSVGGGNLEATAVARAREMIESGAAEPEMHEARLNPHARTEHGRQCCGGVVRLLLEPLAVRPVIALFGLGHVGYELARILSRLPVRLLLVDSRPEQLDRVRLADVIDGTADVGIHHTLLGEQVLEQLPRGAHVVIMTHDHAEDFALCDAALRLPQPLGGIGLIGSSAKWTRFQAQLAAAGHGPEAIARITCPIGQPGITGKDPAVIAVAVAAALLAALGERAAVTVTTMTIYAATVVDTPGDPFAGDPAAALAEDGALLVRDGVIAARGSLAALRAAHPGEPVTRLDGGLLVPGFVDTHVHFPQIRAIGGLGLPLLDWLEQCALPEESKLADQAYARAVAAEFLDGLVAAGTTSALVFGSHFAPAMDELFTAAAQRGLNITSGLVRQRPDPAPRPAELAGDRAGRQRRPDPALARPRAAALRRHAAVLAVGLRRDARRLRAAARQGRLVHLAHQREPGRDRDGGRAVPRGAALPGHLLPARPGHPAQRVRAQRPPRRRRARRAGRARRVGRALPDQQQRPGQRAVPAAPARRARHHVALGSDVGAGAGLFLPKEALQAYFIQQLLGPAGLRLTPVHLLYLATRAGARALGLDDRVGDFAVGKDFDAVLAAPRRREHAGGQPAARPRHDRRAGQDLRPGHPGGRGRGVDPRRAGGAEPAACPDPR